MSTVRAKFQCQAVRKYKSLESPGGFLYEYEFHSATGKDGDNAINIATAPSESLKMTSVREDLFQPGEYYYLELSPVSLNSRLPRGGGITTHYSRSASGGISFTTPPYPGINDPYPDRH